MREDTSMNDEGARVLTPVQIKQAQIMLNRIEKAMVGKPNLVCASALIAAMARLCLMDCAGNLSAALEKTNSLALDVRRSIADAVKESIHEKRKRLSH
jgi:hypothetical protein